MPKLPRTKPAKVIRALQRADFHIDHTTGSHFILYNLALRNTVISVNPRCHQRKSASMAPLINADRYADRR